jgi:hypothetical protein
LLALAAALQYLDREKIIVARLEATAAQNGIGPKQICALALLVPSRARFEPTIKHEPHPNAVRFAAMVDADGKLSETLSNIVDANGSSKTTSGRRYFPHFPSLTPGAPERHDHGLCGGRARGCFPKTWRGRSIFAAGRPYVVWPKN